MSDNTYNQPNNGTPSINQAPQQPVYQNPQQPIYQAPQQPVYQYQPRPMNQAPPQYQQQGKPPMNMLALVGFIVGCVSLLLNFWGLVGIAALILSIIGLVQINQKHTRGKGLAIAGAILGGIGVIWGFASLFMM